MIFQGNWVDLIILVLALASGLNGMHVGFLVMSARVLSFIGSLAIALKFYNTTARFLVATFTLTSSIAKAIAFLSVAFVTETVLGFCFALLLKRFPGRYIRHLWNRPLGFVVGVAQALVIIAFTANLALAFPIKPSIKRDISQSKIAGELLKHTNTFERGVKAVFGEAVEDTLTYLTVKTQSNERVSLDSEVTTLTIDQESETELMRLVNVERAKAGIITLSFRPELVLIARAHARDMWEQKYFSHVSPEGFDIGNRLDKAQVYYMLAGENLAIAPTVTTAHVGLMNSEGHRRNILEPGFRQLGIGVIDNGIYGKMFVQIFTD